MPNHLSPLISGRRGTSPAHAAKVTATIQGSRRYPKIHPMYNAAVPLAIELSVNQADYEALVPYFSVFLPQE